LVRSTLDLFGITLVPGWIFLAIVLSPIPHNVMYGPQAALVVECFTGRLRYSGASLGYQLASVISGGPAPLIATALFAGFHSGYAIALYVLPCAAVSFAAASLMPGLHQPRHLRGVRPTLSQQMSYSSGPRRLMSG
jgi:hypothetical protein